MAKYLEKILGMADYPFLVLMNYFLERTNTEEDLNFLFLRQAPK
jgi:hypothetical protein